MERVTEIVLSVCFSPLALLIVGEKLDIFFLRKRLAEIIALYVVTAHFFNSCSWVRFRHPLR